MRLLSFCLLICLSSTLCDGASAKKNLYQITENNWRDVLTGEWMVQFHAPWCPTCKDMRKAWKAFGELGSEMGVKVAECDVALSPGLSARFLITTLPLIYHIKDGVLRPYTGPRDKEDFLSFVKDKKWTVIEPEASWKHPNTIQMTLASTIFRIGMSARELHKYFITEMGLPTWGSISIFVGSTLLLACILGRLIVFVVDIIFPPTPPARKATEKEKGNAQTDQNGTKDLENNEGKPKPKGNKTDEQKKKKKQ